MYISSWHESHDHVKVYESSTYQARKQPKQIIVFRDNQDMENDGKVNTLPEWTAGSFSRSAQIEYWYLDLELLNHLDLSQKIAGNINLENLNSSCCPTNVCAIWMLL